MKFASNILKWISQPTLYKLKELISDLRIEQTNLLDKRVVEVLPPTSSINNDVKVEPKHKTELDELESLCKELTSIGFLKRQVDTIKDTMQSISKNVGCVLQEELYEEGLTNKNSEFLSLTYKIIEKLENMPSKVQLDDITEEMIREYSFNFESFIKRQKENRDLV